MCGCDLCCIMNTLLYLCMCGVFICTHVYQDKHAPLSMDVGLFTALLISRKFSVSMILKIDKKKLFKNISSGFVR